MAITQVLVVVLVLATTTAGTPARDFIEEDLLAFEEVDIPLLQKKNVRYDFAYSVQDDESGAAYSHQEARTGDVTTGEYRVTLPDGRIQIVSYTADENGYRAKVSYEPVKTYEPAPVPIYPQYKPEPEQVVYKPEYVRRPGYGRRRRPRLRRPNRPRSRVQFQPEEIYFADEEEIVVAEPEEVLVAEHEEFVVHEDPDELIVIEPEEYVVVEPEEIVVVEQGYLPPVPSSFPYTSSTPLTLTPTPYHPPKPTPTPYHPSKPTNHYLPPLTPTPYHPPKPTNHYLPPLTPTPYHPVKPSPTPHYLPPHTPTPYHSPSPSPTAHYLPPVDPYVTPIAKSIPVTTVTPYGNISTVKTPDPYLNPYFPPTAPRSTVSPLYADHPLYHPTTYKPSLSSLFYTPSPIGSTPYPVTTPIPVKITTLHSAAPTVTSRRPTTPHPTTIFQTTRKPKLSTLKPVPSHPPKSLHFPTHQPSPYSPTPPPYPLSSPGSYSPPPPLYGGPSAEPYYPSYLPFFGPQYGPHFPGPSYPPRIRFPTNHPYHGPSTPLSYHGPSTPLPYHGPSTPLPYHGPSTPLPYLSSTPHPKSYHLKGKY